jgi:hypothetical protein
LPTTAPIRWLATAEWAARNEPYFGFLLLTLAGFGSLTTWFAALTGQGHQSIRYEKRSRKLLKWSGLPVAAFAFVLCMSAMWAGIVRPGDLDMENIGALIPFSDAHSHLVSSFDQARDGTWDAFALRRPLAAAFRSVLLFSSDHSFPPMLLIQVCALAIVAAIASYSIVIWRGVWAGAFFFGLTYIYVRAFAPTSLTEPLGLFWALLSVPFFVDAIRTRSVKSALVGFATTSVALLTRMGSMFTIPALMLWLIWQFGTGVASRLRIGCLAIGILLCLLALDSLLENTYGTGSSETGSNFAYTLCGLSIGTTWQGCPEKLAKQGEPLTGEEATVAKRLYVFAWQNFRANPEVLLVRLAGGASDFVKSFPHVIWQGYGFEVPLPAWSFPRMLTALSFLGLAWLARRAADTLETTFWALLWAGIIASSAIVYYDDGARVMAVSHPLIALFFACGMHNPELSTAAKPAANGRLSRYGFIGLLAMAALFLSIPWLAHRLYMQDDKGHQLTSGPNEAFVYGGRRMSGLLVVADEQPLRMDVPTVHFSDFEAIVAQSQIENYQPLLHPMAPQVPFGFVFAPRLEHGVSAPSIFVVPAHVLEKRDVLRWHFKLDPDRSNSNYWFFVKSASPAESGSRP